METAVGGLLGSGIVLMFYWMILLMILLPLLVLLVVAYIFGSMSLYAIAKRRGMQNAWMAWVPVASYWILGSVADDYAMKKYAENRNFRIILLALSIASVCSPLLGSYVASVASMGLVVFASMANYYVFASCKPNQATLFLLLDVLTPAGPFLRFACRNSDDGMPLEPEE